MEGWVTFLLFAAFFYLMMRFGCGAHTVHGGHGGGDQEGHEGHGSRETSKKDPVCGRDVEPGQGYSKMYESREYRFCSRKCLDKFEAEPQRYLS